MRLSSIDILRAFTMLLMIWVNDFWTLTDVPKWLGHAAASEDYMGFSDVIFPLFLFIVGLSIPFAIDHRISKKDGRLSIARHIIIRSLSLLLIGVFMVNYETIHSESTAGGKSLWCILMALAVILIWMDWKKSPVSLKFHTYLQSIGVLILLFLAIIYKGGDKGELWMTTQWWGILGLIGWAYLINALVYVFSKGNLLIVSLLWIVLISLSTIDHTDSSLKISGFLNYFSTIISGTIPAFTSAGMVATLVFRKLSLIKLRRAYLVLIGLGIGTITFGLLTRPYWGISKIQGTPSWLGICTGIGFLLFAALYFIADEKGRVNWAKIIAPAGTATLTCYMIPYIVYPLQHLSGLKLPDYLTSSGTGLFISLIFALLVVVFTGWFERKGFKLKL